MSPLSNHPVIASLRERVGQLAQARFDRAMANGELPENLLLAFAAALADGSVVRLAEDATALQVTIGATSRRWNLVGLNHEYIVQLAVIERLLQVLGESRERLRVEHRRADVAVLRTSSDLVLLQVEVKTTSAGTLREQEDARSSRDSPVRDRIFEIKPERVLFASTAVDAPVWQAVYEGRVVGRVAPTTWDEVGRFLRER